METTQNTAALYFRKSSLDDPAGIEPVSTTLRAPEAVHATWNPA